jgi:hypothetical protein
MSKLEGYKLLKPVNNNSGFVKKEQIDDFK